MLIVRPARLVVHWVASGHTWQARPKRASPPPPERGVIATVRLAGQVTVLSARSMVNWSLANRPSGACSGATLVMAVVSRWARGGRVWPGPLGPSPYTGG